MKPITPENRRAANVNDAFTQLVYPGSPVLGDAVLQPNTDRPAAEGFHIYRMPPGMTTVAHRHNGEEHFYVIEGELIDSDGAVFRKGDIVSYRDGTEHSSYSPNGCTLVVYITGPEVVIEG